MDDDLEGEFVTVHLLQLMLAGEQQDEFEDEFFKLSCVRLMCYGLEEARHNRVSSMPRSRHSFIILNCASHLTLTVYISLHF